MDRRNFLKAFTGAAIGATLIPYLPPSPAIIAEAVASPVTTFRAATLADLLPVLEDTVKRLAIQFEQPSPFYARFLTDLYVEQSAGFPEAR